MTVPLDSDGYLRRACPTCRRQFKWLPQRDSEPAPAGGYHCPYCATQADPDSWWTDDQIRLAEAHAVNMAQEELNKALSGMRRSSGPIRINYKAGSRTPIPRLTEPDDMTITTPHCHASEPIKIDASWDRDIHCLACGAPYAAHP
jgi:Zn ribbon nucleic-acid-binding protein